MVNLDADTADFKKLAQQLKALAPEVRKEMQRALRNTGRPVGEFVAISAGRELPRRGGLGYDIAGARPGVASTASSVSIRFNVRRRWYLAQINQGILRHPVFNRLGPDGRRLIIQQAVAPGSFSRPFEQSAPKVRAEVLDTLQKLLDSKLK